MSTQYLVRFVHHLSYKEVRTLLWKGTIAVSVLYACVGRNWFTYNGHCSGADGTNNFITKGLWETCVTPSIPGSTDFCYSVFTCNNVQDDSWFTNNNITRDFEDRDDDTVFFTDLTRAFMLVALLCASVSFGAVEMFASKCFHDEKLRTLWINTGHFCAVTTSLLCWCGIAFGCLMANSDGRNSYHQSVKVNRTADDELFRRIFTDTKHVMVGQDDQHAFGVTFYFCLLSVVLSTFDGFLVLVSLCTLNCCCNERNNMDEERGGVEIYNVGEEGQPGEQSDQYGDMVDVDEHNNVDTEALLSNMQ